MRSRFLGGLFIRISLLFCLLSNVQIFLMTILFNISHRGVVFVNELKGARDKLWAVSNKLNYLSGVK